MSIRPALPTRRPPTGRAPVRRARAVAAVAAVAAVGLAPLGLSAPAGAATDASAVVISEVYGGGGSASSALARDYVELYNPTSAAVNLAGTSVQYRSSAGVGNPSVTALNGTIPAKGHFLVGEAVGTTGAPVPTPDVEGSIALSGTAGTVFLANQPTTLTAPPTGSLTGNPAVLDLVGYGSTNTFETARTAAPSAATSVSRAADGKDTDDNSADLAVGAGTPTPAAAGGPTDPPADPAPVAKTIEEVQGTGSTSPLAGQVVTTTGVVTGAYPSGGLNGFYLQTAGTGVDVDAATHQASDAVFVFGSAVAGAVRPGDHVEVTGKVSEFAGLTEVTPASADAVKPLAEPATVTPARVVLPRTEASRESFEGMLLAPQGPYTVADNYALNQYAEIGLAAGTTPLYAPTEVADAQDAAAIAAVKADNAARAVTLDDGASANFLTTAKNTPLPYLTQDHQIRVGAPVTFDQPVVLDWRYDLWRFQPTGQLTAAGTPPVSFGHTRTAAPRATGGNVKIASFNVLNYFPTTGAEFVAEGGSCSFYSDRAGDPVTTNTCAGPAGQDGPRGAAEDEDLARQQAKIVHAINSLGADVVSLEELENSAKFGQDRDAAITTLVAALNQAAGAGTWSFVPSPVTAGDQSDEDVIRTGFIYKSAAVEPVGASVIDDVPTFDNARDPLAQAFETVGGGTFSRFAVIVNHFKSKGSGPADPDGQGNSNAARVAQAQELERFAEQVKTDAGTDKLFLSGDFNAYTQEDPLQVLYAAGYTDIGSDPEVGAPEEHTYLFDGTVGSLDHVLANEAALGRVTGAHVWNINSVESVALEYSRVNYNATDFYEDSPFRASDHDPLVVGLDLPTGAVPTTTSARVSPDPVVARTGRPVLTARVTSTYGTIDEGHVVVAEGREILGVAQVQDGVATLTLPASNQKGRHTLTVGYVGTREVRSSWTTTSYTVVKK